VGRDVSQGPGEAWQDNVQMIEHYWDAVLVDLREVGELTEYASRIVELFDRHVKMRVAILGEGLLESP
jgi:hypothetical protein